MLQILITKTTEPYTEHNVNTRRTPEKRLAIAHKAEALDIETSALEEREIFAELGRSGKEAEATIHDRAQESRPEGFGR